MHMKNHANALPTRVCPEEDSDQYLHVSLFPAQHCPGSVVYIFEGSFGKYVYTGDIRLEFQRELESTPSYLVDFDLASEDVIIPWAKLSNVDRLFMDTTFADALWEHLPPRIDTISAVINLIESLDKETQILLECEMLGTEQVIVGVSEHFGQPFYAESKLYAKLEVVPGLKKYLAQKPVKNSEISPKNQRFLVVPHGAFSKGNLDRAYAARSLKRSVHAIATPKCFIKPSTQWFGAKTVGKIVDLRPVLHDGVWHILYSIHSSYQEIRRFVEHIRPKSISPLVSCSKAAFRELEALCAVAPSSGAETGDMLLKSAGAFFASRDGLASAMTLHGKSEAELVLKANSALEDSIELSVYECLYSEESSVKVSEEGLPHATVDPALWKSPSNEKAKTLFDESLSYDSDPDLVLSNPPNSSHMPVSEPLVSAKRRTAPDSTLSLFDLVASDSSGTHVPPSKKACGLPASPEEDVHIPFQLVYDVEGD
jgi:hypothetical protein